MLVGNERQSILQRNFPKVKTQCRLSWRSKPQGMPITERLTSDDTFNHALGVRSCSEQWLWVAVAFKFGAMEAGLNSFFSYTPLYQWALPFLSGGCRSLAANCDQLDSQCATEANRTINILEHCGNHRSQTVLVPAWYAAIRTSKWNSTTQRKSAWINVPRLVVVDGFSIGVMDGIVGRTLVIDVL